jgi:cytochrome c553
MKTKRLMHTDIRLYFTVAAMVAATAILLMQGAAYADETASPAARAASIAHAGTPSGIPACAACHGAVGEGNAAVGYPRLAGLPGDYLAQELANFSSGARSNPMMNPVAKLLDASDRAALAAFYASQPSSGPGRRTDQTAVAAEHGTGEQIALHGKWSEGVPACVSCHGSQGSGVGADFPALAGQSSIYIRNQFAAWKSGTRPPGPLGLMVSIASRLSSSEVDAVADYFAALPAVSRGNTP